MFDIDTVRVELHVHSTRDRRGAMTLQEALAGSLQTLYHSPGFNSVFSKFALLLGSFWNYFYSIEMN